MCNFFLSVSFIASVKVRIFPLNMCDIIIYVAQWWEKYLSRRSPLKHTCPWRGKLIVLLPKHFWNLQMLRITEKFKNWKFLLKISWKIDKPFESRIWKIGTPHSMFTRQVEKLTRLCHVTHQVESLTRLWNVGTFIGTLACKNEKLECFWQVDTLARGHVRPRCHARHAI